MCLHISDGLVLQFVFPYFPEMHVTDLGDGGRDKFLIDLL